MAPVELETLPPPAYYVYHYPYYDAATTDSYSPPVDDNTAKAIRKRWLEFTRGNGWDETLRVAERRRARVPRRAIVQPGLRMVRRPGGLPRPLTMKQLRRMGVV